MQCGASILSLEVLTKTGGAPTDLEKRVTRSARHRRCAAPLTGRPRDPTPDFDPVCTSATPGVAAPATVVQAVPYRLATPAGEDAVGRRTNEREQIPRLHKAKASGAQKMGAMLLLVALIYLAPFLCLAVLSTAPELFSSAPELWASPPPR